MHDPERTQPRPNPAVDESSRPQTRLDLLTPRQRAIGQLIARGHTDDEIGAKLALERTEVAETAEDIRVQLGLERRVQIAALLSRDHTCAASAASYVRRDGQSADERPQLSQIREQAEP